jgi:DNA polymerase III alpha subunit
MSTNNLNNLTEAVMIHGPDILSDCAISAEYLTQYLDRITEERLPYPIPLDQIDIEKWFIPDEYAYMDIEEFLIGICPEQNYDRLISELHLFRDYKMIPVLCAMKYIVDTLRKNNIVWGVGRGSSVASYVLFLLGVHRIDSVKYRLPIEEFFKEIQNG